MGTYTEDDGSYLVAGLDPGDYLVRFEGSEVGLVGEFYDDAVWRDDADLVAVVGGQTTTHVDATLVPGGSIAGTILGPDGPAVGVWVTVSGDSGWWNAMTDGNGDYLVGGLPTGLYTVRFEADEIGLVSEYFDDSFTFAGAKATTR